MTTSSKARSYRQNSRTVAWFVIGLYVVAAAFLVYFLRWALFDAQF